MAVASSAYYSISAKEKLAVARQYKQAGNDAFKAKQFRSAIRSYHKALLYIRGVDQHAVRMPKMLATAQQEQQREERAQEITKELNAAAEELKIDVYNNLSACLLQDGERFSLAKVLEYCNEVETLQPTNRKCWFRRGQAYVKAGDFESATHSLNKAKSFMTESDTALERLLATCRRQLKQQYEQQKSLYRGMFSTPANGSAKTSIKSEHDGTVHNEGGGEAGGVAAVKAGTCAASEGAATAADAGAGDATIALCCGTAADADSGAAPATGNMNGLSGADTTTAHSTGNSITSAEGTVNGAPVS